MVTNRIAVLLMAVVLLAFTGCAAILGYSIGDKIDQNNAATQAAPDSLQSAMKSVPDSTQSQSGTHYAWLGLGVGLTLDLAIIMIILLQTNPISPPGIL
jgi:hypothetical protein